MRHALFASLFALSACGGPSTSDDAGRGMDARPALDAGPACVPIVGACTSDGDCCPGLRCADTFCTDRPCRAAGEICDSDGDCCGLPCEWGLCGGIPACAPIGASCAEPTECCGLVCAGGVCDVNSLARCTSVGESCTSNDECCSDRCADASGAPCAGGECRCLRSAFCGADGQLCTSDAECCSGTCRRSGRETVGTCASSGCLAPGEPCAAGSACCSGSCSDTDGTRICDCPVPVGASCTLAGTACDPQCSTCCLEPFDLACHIGPGGTNVCCLPEGEACAFDELCCTGICAQDASGSKRCASTCAPDGEPCGDTVGCCGCCTLVNGTPTCTSDPGPCTGECSGVGGFCISDADCCDSTALRCDIQLKFSTCVLR